MSFEENVRAILNCNFSETKEEIIDIAVKRICELKDNGKTNFSRPQGEWSDESKDSLLCSACGKHVYKPFIGGFPTERTSHYYPNFCAFCGADMRKGGAV